MKQHASPNRRSPQATLLGALLQQGRETLGLSQKRAAAEIGVTASYLSRLERGLYSHPSPDILLAAAKLYNTDMADFYAATGYITATELPSFPAYIQAKHPGCPMAAAQALTHFYEYIKKEYSLK